MDPKLTIASNLYKALFQSNSFNNAQLKLQTPANLTRAPINTVTNNKISATALSSSALAGNSRTNLNLGTIGALLSELQRSLAVISTFTGEIAGQRELDRASGIGLWQGANNAAQQMQQQMQNMQAEQAISDYIESSIYNIAADRLAGNPSGMALDDQLLGVLNGAGQAGQALVLNALKDEAKSYLAEALQVAPQELSIDGVFGSLLGQEQAVTTQLPGTVAAPAANGFGKLAGAAGAIYSAYNLLSGWGKYSVADGALNGATIGAYIGSVIPGLGTLLGGAVGGLLGGISGLFKKHKHKDRVQRDAFRELLQKAGFIDSDLNLKLADGSNFYIGRDGSDKFTGMDGSKLYAFNVDSSHPLSARVVSWVNPLVAAMTQGHLKLQTDFVGYLTNAALSNTADLEGARANVLKFFESSGVTPEQIAQSLAGLYQQGKIPEQHLYGYINAMQDLFSVGLEEETKL